MWYIKLWISAAHHISFLPFRFSVRHRFLFPILRGFFTVKSPIELFKDRFLKKMLLKRAKTCRLCFTKLQAQIFSYSSWKQFQVFKIAKFEFKVTVPYSLWAKGSQLWPINTSGTRYYYNASNMATLDHFNVPVSLDSARICPMF